MADVSDTDGSRVTVEQSVDSAGAVVLKMAGELDAANADALRAEISPTVDARPDRIIFDLEHLSFMDSSGIAVLLSCATKAGAVEVRNASAIIRRIIEATGVDHVLRLQS
jgi:anti-anti-sigma factor